MAPLKGKKFPAQVSPAEVAAAEEAAEPAPNPGPAAAPAAAAVAPPPPAKPTANPFAKAREYHEQAALADRNRVDWDPEDESLHYITGQFHGIREFPSKKLAGQPARFAVIVEYDESTGEPTGRAISIPLHTALASRLGPLPTGCFVILEYVGKKLSTSGQAFHQWIVTAFDEHGEPVKVEEGVPF